jgi:hypothetical protein
MRDPCMCGRTDCDECFPVLNRPTGAELAAADAGFAAVDAHQLSPWDDEVVAEAMRLLGPSDQLIPRLLAEADRREERRREIAGGN